MSWNLDNAVEVEVKEEWNLDGAIEVKMDTHIHTGFSLERFTGSKVLRASINTYRIHIWNFFMPDMRLEVKQQELVDSGLLNPKIAPDGDSILCEKIEFLKGFVKKVEFTSNSRFYLTVFLNTPDSEVLGKVVEYLKDFGVKVKFELAGKDEIKVK